MPKSPRTDSGSDDNEPNLKRSFLLILTGIGAFIVGRSSEIQWSKTDYVRGISNLDKARIFITSKANASETRAPQPEQVPNLLRDAPYYLNDKSLRLSPYVDRAWLHNGDLLPDGPKPKMKLILTEWGWNQRDQEIGMKYVRSMRKREITQAVIDHPNFDPTFSWTDMMEGKIQPDPDIQYFVFLDVEECFESNFPKYAGWFPHNADRALDRKVKPPAQCRCLDIMGCDWVKKTLESPLFQQVPTARLFYFDCRGFGVNPGFRKQQQSPQISILSISAEPSQLLSASDMGLPPPAIHPVRLSHRVRERIMTTCEEEKRPYFLTCIGNVRNNVRQQLFTLHNETDGVLLMLEKDFKEQYTGKATYEGVMKDSVFAAAPRGDNRFSYRFTEVLSSGAIPVIHSDGWVLPFRRELIDWGRDCAVVIPEAQVLDTVRILKNITVEERCRRRKRCYEVYTRYMANSEGNLAGILESAQLAIQSLNTTRGRK